MAILVVNNLRDIETDRAAGKKTIAVRIGAAQTMHEYALLLALAYAIPLFLLAMNFDLVWLVLVYASVPYALRLYRIVRTAHGRALNAALGGTAQLEFLYALLFAFGLILARVF
jgi:1,4-dihydroxy-2-naphthoate octaprenyltransferase